VPNIVPETGLKSSMPSTIGNPDSVGHYESKYDSHAAKVARIEVAPSQGFHVNTAKIPPKIEEVTEPD